MTVDSSEDEGVPATPPCAQSAPSLDTVYHQVVEGSRLKRKAEVQTDGRAPLSLEDKSPLTPLVEACERERHRQQTFDAAVPRQDCGFCALTAFVPTFQRMLEDLKDYLVRAETGLAIAEGLLDKCQGGCVCAPSDVAQKSAKRRALGSPFQPRQERSSVKSTRRFLEEVDTSGSDDDVPIRRTRRSGRR